MLSSGVKMKLKAEIRPRSARVCRVAPASGGCYPASRRMGLPIICRPSRHPVCSSCPRVLCVGPEPGSAKPACIRITLRESCLIVLNQGKSCQKNNFQGWRATLRRCPDRQLAAKRLARRQKTVKNPRYAAKCRLVPDNAASRGPGRNAPSLP